MDNNIGYGQNVDLNSTSEPEGLNWIRIFNLKLPLKFKPILFLTTVKLLKNNQIKENSKKMCCCFWFFTKQNSIYLTGNSSVCYTFQFSLLNFCTFFIQHLSHGVNFPPAVLARGVFLIFFSLCKTQTNKSKQTDKQKTQKATNSQFLYHIAGHIIHSQWGEQKLRYMTHLFHFCALKAALFSALMRTSEFPLFISVNSSLLFYSMIWKTAPILETQNVLHDKLEI